MGIYRTLLEDNVNILDSDNDGSKEMKELMGEIDNAEINASEVENAAEAEFGDGESVSDIMDESYMIIAESEMAWNEVMQAIGIREADYARRGVEVIYEAPDIKGFFKKAKDKIVETFKKIWEVIQRWAKNVMATVTLNKKFAEKYATQIAEGEKIYNRDKSIKRIDGYSFAGLDAGIKMFTVEFVSEKAFNDVNKNDDKEVTTADAKEIVNALRKKMSGSSGQGDFRDNVLKMLRGSDDKGKTHMTASEVIDILTDKDNARKTVKDAATQMKKEMKAALRELESTEKAAKQDKDGKAMTAAAIAISLTKQLIAVSSIFRSALLSCISQRKRQARKFGNLYVRISNKNDKKGFHKGYKESSEYGFLGSLNLV